MRDDSFKWDVPSAEAITLAGGVTVKEIGPSRQVLLSGVGALRVTELPLIGWPGDASADAVALVLRRDRVLEINGPHRVDGWDDAIECAVSDMTSGYKAFSIEGEGALDLLKRGAFVDPAVESRSVARLAFGLPALLYRRVAPESYRLHVSSSSAQTFRKALLSLHL